jgi:aminomethyltransferase
MVTGPETPRRTPLHERHIAAGAKLVDFAGWELPVQYAGARAEHMAVREACGIFDVSHMGQIETSGPGALALLQRLLSNDVAAIPVGGAQYSVLCREDGGVLDDLFTYRLAQEHYLTVTNAANHTRDLEWFRAHAGALGVTRPDDARHVVADVDAETGVGREAGVDAEAGVGREAGAGAETGLAAGAVRVEDRLEAYAMLAVQGPRAREIVQGLAGAALPTRMTAAKLELAGAEVLVCATGYTGEDGVELLAAPADAPALWDELVRRGATPAGLAARDTLRLEACFHLYGNDLMVERGPIAAGLGWCCKEQTGFIGADAVRAARESGPAEKLAAFAIDGPGIARQGNAVVGGGVVTSGTLSPCLGVGIGLAYVPTARAAVGTPLEIDVRGRTRAATVQRKPFVAKHA